MERIRDTIYTVTENLGSNDSAIVTSQGIVLIDTPHKPTDALDWYAFVVTLGRVKYLINTDHHPDHTTGNYFLPGEIISHEGTRERLVNHPLTPEHTRELMEFMDKPGLSLIENGFYYRPPTITYHDRMTLYLGDTELRLFHRRAHTPNSTLIYLPKEKVLFSGDIVCSNGLPCLMGSCLREWVEVLDELESLDFTTIVPGHGQPVEKNYLPKFKKEMTTLFDIVRERKNKGQSKEQIAAEVHYQPDQIHCSTQHYIGYCDEEIEKFRVGTIFEIYQQIEKGLL